MNVHYLGLHLELAATMNILTKVFSTELTRTGRALMGEMELLSENYLQALKSCSDREYARKWLEV